MPLADMPQANKQHAVPQNIMDVEFKLIGDLTLRQFMYLLVFGGASYLTYVSLVGFFKFPIAALLAILGMGLAFVPIQERGMDEWIVNFVRAVYSPTQRVWRRELTIPSAFMHENLAVVKQELIALAPTSSRRKLEEYLEYQVKSENKDPLDIPELEYIQKVRDAYVGYIPEPKVGVSVLEPVVDTNTFGQVPFEEIPSMPETSEQPEETSNPTDAPETKESKEEVSTTVAPTLGTAPAAAQPLPVSSMPSAEVSTVSTMAPTPSAPEQTTKPTAPPVQKPTPKPAAVIHKKPAPAAPINRPISAPNGHPMPFSSPMTPDRHAGRRFTNLVPGSGELVLPIRGERVIKTSEQVEIDDDIQEKAKKLQELLSQIKTGASTTSTRPQQAPLTPAVQSPQLSEEPAPIVDTEAKKIASNLQEEDKRLTDEIDKLKQEKARSASADEAALKDSMIRKLEAEKERSKTDYESLQRQILDLQNKLKEQTPAQSSGTAPSVPMPKFTSGQVVPGGKVNVLGGRVTLANGAVQAGVLIIVKNAKGETVRAFKTNQLGEFKLSTPLANGLYTVEVATNINGLSFDIITVEAKGEMMPYMEMVGK